MKHDLIIDWQVEYGGYHNGFAECRRCGDFDSPLCCNEEILTEECPDNQLEMFTLDECGPVVLN